MSGDLYVQRCGCLEIWMPRNLDVWNSICPEIYMSGDLDVTVDPVTSPKAPQSGRQRKRESAGSATNSELHSNSRRKDSRVSRRSPGHHTT